MARRTDGPRGERQRSERGFMLRAHTLAEIEAYTKHRQELKRAAAERVKTKREKKLADFYARGLSAKGVRYTSYLSWRSARTSHARRGKRAYVDALDREYPDYFARLDDETSLAGRERRRDFERKDAVRRNVLSQQRHAQYRREDIVSGDVRLTSYPQFVREYDRARRGQPHQNSALCARLRDDYPQWYTKYRNARRVRRYKMRKVKPQP